MSILTQNVIDDTEILNTIDRFFSKHHIGKLLSKCGGSKEKGVSAVSILRYRLGNIFDSRGSMYMQQRVGSFKEGFSRNTYYRFLNSVKTNWLRFTTLLSTSIINDEINGLTDEKRVSTFIIDDSLFGRSSCKMTELGSRVFDHVEMRYKKGFRLLTLGWSDGFTFMPVNSTLLASSKDSNILGPVNTYDKRSIAGKRRMLAQMKATDAMITLLKTALHAGLRADYVLFDTWFANPAQILSIKMLGMDTIAMIKKSSRIKYDLDGRTLNVKEIFSESKKRRGRSRYLLSVNVMLGKNNAIPAKIVFVRNKVNRKEWLALICTNTELSEDEIIRIYGRRWDIEVFFKTSKSLLKLTSECHCLSYDALTAHVAIVFTRYMLLALEQRGNEDLRTLGELFYFLVNEVADTTFNQSLQILMQAMIASMQETLRLSDDQIETFMIDFAKHLPKYLQRALNLEQDAA